MSERRTAINCPEHGSCVCILVTVPEQEVPEGRKPLKLPMQYTPWLQSQSHVVLQVEHEETEDSPDGLLVGDLIIAPKDIKGRMLEAEKALGRQVERHKNNAGRIDALEGNHKMLRAELASLRDQAKNDRTDAALLGDLAALRASAIEKRLDELEAFVTRKPRWKKAWDRGRED